MPLSTGKPLEVIKESIQEAAPVLPAAPKQVFENISPRAQEMMAKLDDALRTKDFSQMGEVLFDCECEDLDDQIDLKWYQAQIIQGEAN